MDDRELDLDVRRAAFEFLSNATKQLGDVLPWKLLIRDFAYRGERVCLIGASGILKPALLPHMPISICTAPPPPSGQSARYDDRIGEGGCLHYRYRGRDPHPDNAGLREAMRRGAPLVYFYGVAKGQYLATWPVFITGDDPQALTFQVSVDDHAIGATELSDADATLVRDVRRQYVTALTVRRLHQQSSWIGIRGAEVPGVPGC